VFVAMGVSQAARFVSSGFRMTEAVDEILADVDRGSLHASQAIERLLTVQITRTTTKTIHTRPCS
jgi:phage regulator Rha-like protein